MPQPLNHWKLGAFVLASLLLAAVVVTYLGAAKLGHGHLDYVSYFDESVQGLDPGAPVKFRGVPVGHVSSIGVAADRRHVAVTMSLGLKELGDFRLKEVKDGKVRIYVPPDLRAQVASQGITGLKFVQLDFFDETRYPPPMLSFLPPERYIPAAVSTLKNVESAVVSASNSLPVMLEGLARVTDRSARMMEQLESQKLPEHLAATLEHLDGLLARLDQAIAGADVKGLSAQVRRVLDHLEGDRGLVASAQRAADSFGDLASMSPEIGAEVADTLRELREAAASVRRVAEALERDPDMLIKGRKVQK
jgi:phospholipid/cholesterol/gamma-HCH transport system substrate-binding protein